MTIFEIPEVILKRIFLVVLPVLLLMNCAQLLRKRPLSTENISVYDVKGRVKQNYLKLFTIKGRAHLSMEMPGMGFTAASNIILKMPDSLSIKVRAGLGLGIGSIFIDGKQFTIYSVMENRVYYGDIESFNLNQFLQINIKFQELFGLISGIPLIEESDHSILSIDGNKYLVTIKTDSLIKKYWVDPRRFVVTDLHLYNKKNELVIKQEFRQFYKEKGVVLPKIIKINRLKGKERVTLMYTNRKTNEKLKPEDFSIKIPDNTHRIDL